MTTIVYPEYFQVYRCKGSAHWTVSEPKLFYNPNPAQTLPKPTAEQFGLTDEKVVFELFRRFEGKIGYYLANLRARKYYYCGTELEDVKTMLRSLGIGRKDPMEKI